MGRSNPPKLDYARRAPRPPSRSDEWEPAEWSNTWWFAALVLVGVLAAAPAFVFAVFWFARMVGAG